jgi:cold shock CspA family protein
MTYAGKVRSLVAHKGYGFIESGGGSWFFNASDSRHLLFSTLRVGDLVEFQLATTERGERAVDVRRMTP